MKSTVTKILSGLCVGVVLGAVVMWTVSKVDARHSEATSPAQHEQVKVTANPLHLTAAQRTAAGIVLANPSRTRLTPEIEAYGRVLDPGPYLALLAERESAQTTVDASTKLAERASRLFAAGTSTSAQTAEAAEATRSRDAVAAVSAKARLVVGWGEALAKADLSEMLAVFERGGAIARIDCLPGDEPDLTHVGAMVSTIGGQMLEAEIVGSAPVADPQLQAVSVLVLMKRGAPPVGSALRAKLVGTGAAQDVIQIRSSAIVYHQGSAWVFVLGEDDTFERKWVTVTRTIGDQVVIEGIDVDQQVVTSGAQQLLSSELQTGEVQEDE